MTSTGGGDERRDSKPGLEVYDLDVPVTGWRGNIPDDDLTGGVRVSPKLGHIGPI